MDKEVKFSRREWWLLISILVLIQFVVQGLSYQYSGNTNALGYISFAGTLVSIILGLVAIIYSFVQSISHTSTVAEIKEQVERLILAGVDIAKSKDDLHLSALELSKIADDLADKVNENTNVTKEVVGSVSKLNDAFVFDREPANAKINSEVNNTEAGSIIESNRVIAVLMVLAIAEGCKREFSGQDVLKKILAQVSEDRDMAYEFISGSFHAVYFALEAEGFIEVSEVEALDIKIVARESFFERVRKITPGTMDGSNKIFTSFWLVVNNLD